MTCTNEALGVRQVSWLAKGKVGDSDSGAGCRVVLVEGAQGNFEAALSIRRGMDQPMNVGALSYLPITGVDYARDLQVDSAGLQIITQ